MSFYRDKYLKSDEWKSLRKEAIIKDGFRCRLCHGRPIKVPGKSLLKTFQVHHLEYKNLFDVGASDLRTLCPDCHMKVHELMGKYPKMKKLGRAVQWQTVLYHLRPDMREQLAGMVRGISKKGVSSKQKNETDKDRLRYGSSFVFFHFHRIKKELFDKGLICKGRMKWRDGFYKNEVLSNCINSGGDLIQAYLEVTKQDPRRLIPVLWRPQ